MEVISTKEYLNYKPSNNQHYNNQQNLSTTTTTTIIQSQLLSNQHSTNNNSTTYLVCDTQEGYDGLNITNEPITIQTPSIINTTFNNDFEFTKAPLTPLTNSYFNLDHLDLCLPLQIAPNKCIINTQSQQQQQQHSQYSHPQQQLQQPFSQTTPSNQTTSIIPTVTSSNTQPPGLIRSISTPSFSLKFSSSLPNLVFKSPTVLDDIENQIDNVTISEQPLAINQNETTTTQFTTNSILFDLNLDNDETENEETPTKDALLNESNILTDKTTIQKTNHVNINENQEFVSDNNKTARDLGVDLKDELNGYYTSVYTCFHRSCGMDFNTKDSIIEHIKENHQDKLKNTREIDESLIKIDDNYLASNTKFMYKCLYNQFCNKKMDNLNKIINHICKTHLENSGVYSSFKKYFICSYDDCLLSFNNESALNKHKQIHKTSKTPNKYVCNLCQSTFVRPSHLNNHLKVHENMKLKCDYCDEKFMKQSLLIQHLFDKHKHTSNAIKCTECDKEFISNMHLKSHYKKVHKNGREECLKCSYCEKVFDLPWLKRSHEELVHKKVKKYICTFEGCNKAFPTSSKLNRHNLTHSNVKQFKCTYDNCTAEFNRKDHLLSHLKSHSDEKSFVCNYPNCEATFKYLSNLQAHKKTHVVISSVDKQEEFSFQTNTVELLENTTEKPDKYKCDTCNKQFKTKLNLNIHKKAHKEERISDKNKSKIKPIQLQREQENNGYESVVQTNDLFYETTAKYIKLNSNCSKTNLSKTTNNLERLKHKHVIIMNSDDEEYAPTSVVIENLSGSARTDYKSNHMYIERSRIRQQERRNQLDNLKNKFKPIQESFNNETINNNTPNNEHIFQIPCFSKTFNAKLTRSCSDNDLSNIDTSKAIYIKDPITGNTIIQTQILQDDPPYFLDVTDKSY